MAIYATDYPYKEWMSNLPEVLTKLPINYLAIPGSHDSFTYNITSNSDVAPDAESAVKKISSILGKIAKTVIAHWAKAQALNAFGQLEAGIRYLDIRSARNKYTKNGDIYACHSLFAGQIRDNLIQINDFLNIHRKEVVLLDFNHFYAMGTNDHNRLARQIEEIFGSKLIVYSNYIPSLETIWKGKGRVFVFYHNRSITRPYFWPSYSIPSPWPNVDKLPPLEEFWKISYQRGHDYRYFYVLQAVLTPGVWDIVLHVASSLKSRMADVASPAFAKWLEDKSAGKGKINVSIIDFADGYNYVASVMQVNLNMASELTNQTEMQ